MSYYILGTNEKEYKKKTSAEETRCIALLLVTVAVNILLCSLRTEAVHTVFLILNIVTDTVVFSFLFFFINTQIVPRKKLCAVAAGENRGSRLTGIISEIAGMTETVRGFACYEVTVETEMTRKVYAVKEGAVPFELTGEATLVLVDNLIVRAEAQ